MGAERDRSEEKTSENRLLVLSRLSLDVHLFASADNGSENAFGNGREEILRNAHR